MWVYASGYGTLCVCLVRVGECIWVCGCAGSSVSEFLLLETVASLGLSEALQDAVAGAIGDAAVIPIAQVKDLLVGAGVGLAAAKRILGRLVRLSLAG